MPSPDQPHRAAKMEVEMARYRNPWHRGRAMPQYGPEFYETDAKPTEYRGFLIYQSVKGQVWDVVQDGVCITQRAGPNGAKQFIDQQNTAT